MCKKSVLMRDIISKHHPDFRNPAIKRLGLKKPHLFNIERLVEESLAAVGPYTFIDVEHCDFSDNSDSKTASIRVKQSSSINSFAGEISNVSTAGGNQKTGALRCIIYNPHTEGLMFYFLPKRAWKNMVTIHPTSGIGKIMYKYNRKTNTIKKLEGYECNNFKELALAK